MQLRINAFDANISEDALRAKESNVSLGMGSFAAIGYLLIKGWMRSRKKSIRRYAHLK